MAIMKRTILGMSGPYNKDEIKNFLAQEIERAKKR